MEAGADGDEGGGTSVISDGPGPEHDHEDDAWTDQDHCDGLEDEGRFSSLAMLSDGRERSSQRGAPSIPELSAAL